MKRRLLYCHDGFQITSSGAPAASVAAPQKPADAICDKLNTMILNESESFHDVRYLINSRISDDVELSFIGIPPKILLEKGIALVRLDFPVVFGFFAKHWWMRQEVWRRIMQSADPGAAALRREWQHKLAMPKASKGVRTLVIEIELTAPVYAWVGAAAPLFNKEGGEEQVYLPNLSRGTGPNRSDFARLRRTYTLPAS